MRSLSRKLTLGTFLALVLLPVLLFQYDGPWPGEGEVAVRGKAPFPYRFTPSVYEELDQWFADRVGLRYPMIYLGTKLHVDLLHRPLDNHIFLGQDGWMFWSDDGESTPATMIDARGKLRFKPAEVQQIDTELQVVRDRFIACGIPLVILIAPNKQSIYGENIFGAHRTPPQTRFGALMESLSAPAKSLIVDARGSMLAGKQRNAPTTLFNKTESHWNDLGAYYGYRAVIDALSKLTPVPYPERTALDHYTLSVAPYPGGDMATRVLFSPWRFKDDNVELRPKIPVKEVFIEHRNYKTRNPQGRGRLLLIGDSFTYHLTPFLAQHFEEVHRHIRETIDGAIVGSYRPDVVLWVTVERHAYRLLRPAFNLDQTCKK